MGRRPGRPLPPALNLAALLLLLLLTGVPRSLAEAQRAPCNASATPPGGLFSFCPLSMDGRPVPLERYRGRTTLVVNVATF